MSFTCSVELSWLRSAPHTPEHSSHRRVYKKAQCKLRCLQWGWWIMCVPAHACQTTADHVPLPHRLYCKWQVTTLTDTSSFERHQILRQAFTAKNYHVILHDSQMCHRECFRPFIDDGNLYLKQFVIHMFFGMLFFCCRTVRFSPAKKFCGKILINCYLDSHALLTDTL